VERPLKIAGCRQRPGLTEGVSGRIDVNSLSVTRPAEGHDAVELIAFLTGLFFAPRKDRLVKLRRKNSCGFMRIRRVDHAFDTNGMVLVGIG
jgi:hypothetical protein